MSCSFVDDKLNRIAQYSAGLLDGLSVQRRESDQVVAETFLNGKRVGRYVSWDGFGRVEQWDRDEREIRTGPVVVLLTDGSVLNGRFNVDGRADGDFTQTDSDGDVVSQFTMDDGTGVWVEFVNGELTRVMPFQGGKKAGPSLQKVGTKTALIARTNSGDRILSEVYVEDGVTNVVWRN